MPSDTDEDASASKAAHDESQDNAASVSKVASSTDNPASSSSQPKFKHKSWLAPNRDPETTPSKAETAKNADRRDQMLQMTATQLNEKSRVGLALIKAFGWFHGQTRGAQTSESSLLNPLKTRGPLTQIIPIGSVNTVSICIRTISKTSKKVLTAQA